MLDFNVSVLKLKSRNPTVILHHPSDRLRCLHFHPLFRLRDCVPAAGLGPALESGVAIQMVRFKHDFQTIMSPHMEARMSCAYYRASLSLVHYRASLSLVRYRAPRSLVHHRASFVALTRLLSPHRDRATFDHLTFGLQDLLRLDPGA
jgi:hypothetical protein